MYDPPGVLLLRQPLHRVPRPGDGGEPLLGLRLQGDQLPGPAGQGGHRQDQRGQVTIREVISSLVVRYYRIYIYFTEQETFFIHMCVPSLHLPALVPDNIKLETIAGPQFS